jgi:hypothetical protein
MIDLELSKIFAAHNKELAELDAAIFRTKRDVHNRNRDIQKVKVQVTRFQALLRKHGIPDIDVRLCYFIAGADLNGIFI